MVLLKSCRQYASKSGKLSSGHKTGKSRFSFQYQKKGNAKDCLDYCTLALTSHACKLMLKIIQARLQHCVNQELPDVQAGFRKSRGIRDIWWIKEKAKKFQKNIYFCFVDYTKAFDCVEILRDVIIRPP